MASPLSARALAAGSVAALLGRDARKGIAEALARDFYARHVALTDSGTGALALALRIVAPHGEAVAFPAYACVDLVAAARRAGVRMHLYDLDPTTLAPDAESLARVVRSGVAAVVAVHLYGFPVDVPAIRDVAASAGIPVIEDAAQQAGATLRGVRAGAMGDLVVLSFGRGKGMSAGRGGALLARESRFDDAVTTVFADGASRSRGVNALFGAAASWALGRPALYAFPAAIPALHLGETVYHEAAEPRPMSSAALALLAHAMDRAAGELAVRRTHAAELLEGAAESRRARPIVPLPGAAPGYLRFPVLTNAHTPRVPQLGIVGAYPRPLAEEPEAAAILDSDGKRHRGARHLARRLVTLPTHHLVTPRDIKRLRRWLEGWT